MLVPELDVTALGPSVRFYAEVLEFRILFERPAERFASLEALEPGAARVRVHRGQAVGHVAAVLLRVQERRGRR